MIRDLYDKSIVVYKTGTEQTVNLVLDAIRSAMKKEKMKVAANMSRRGNCYDNAMAENFFSILKTECIYRQKIASFTHAGELIDSFISFYNNERVRTKTEVATLTLRHSA